MDTKFFKNNLQEINELITDKLYHSKDILEHYGFQITPSNVRRVSEYIRKNKLTLKFNQISDINVRILMKHEANLKEWYNINEVVEIIKNKLKNNLIINNPDKSGNNSRYVISFKGHPRASKTHQVKAHLLIWELHNKKSFPEGFVLVPKDGNFLNLDINNFDIIENNKHRSIVASGARNHFYVNGKYDKIKYKGDWCRISKNFLKNNKCSYCGETELKKLNSHHIISYFLFKEYKEAHNILNLICLCDKCHGSLHGGNFNIIKGSLSEMTKEKLIELLETLKDDLDNDLKPLYEFSFKSISSQADLSEGSTTIPNGSTSQA